MKSKLFSIITAVTLLAFPNVNFGQVTLGTDASKFVLFTSSGSVGDNASAHSLLTGDVGTVTAGPMVGFGNVNGIMHPGADAATTACDIDLLSTIAQINALPATLVGPLSLGNGFTITPGVWSIPGNATQTLDLYIDGQNNPNSEFIIKVAGTFSANTLSRVKLINGALACHVFWKIDGAVTMASLSTMRGNVITGGAIIMGSGDSLEGRMFSTPAGAITIDNIVAFTPIGCGSPVLTGPNSPPLGSLECYSIFTGIGALDGNLSTTSIGDVGNAGGGTVTGWTAGNVTGTLHGTGDPSTMLAATDLTTLYNTLNAMTVDIPLEFPVQFGRDLVLTPHVYLLNSALNGPATLTDSLYLDAQGNANAVFVIKVINGAFTTSVNARVKLINGAQAKNVFWMVDGAVSIADNSIFRGTVVVSAGAFSIVSTGITFDGRALSQNGAITTAGLAIAVPSGYASGAGSITGPDSVCFGQSGVIYSTSIISGASGYNWTLPPGATITAGANTNSITVDFTGASSGNFNLTVQGTGSCGNGTVSVNFPVTVNALPIVLANANPTTVCAGNSVTLTGSGATSYIWSGGVTNGIGFVPTSTNTYTVTGTDVNSCSNTATTTVTVNALPIVLANANPTTVCAGNSVTLTGSGATSYIWSGGVTNGIGFVPTSTNTYTVTGTNGNNCSNTATTTVTVNALPIVIANANPTTVCAGNSVTLTGSGATSYIWSGGVTNGIGFVPTSTNTYTVTGTNGNNCSNTATTTVTVNALPIVIANANPTTVCTGNSVTLTGSGATSYIWSGGVINGIGFVPTSTNTYTVTGTDVNSCSNTATTTVVVNPIPVALATSNSPVCIGSSINLTAQTVSGGTYSWTGPNGFSSASQNPILTSATTAEAGTYTLTVSSNGCTSASSTVTIIVNDCVGVADLGVVKTVDNTYPFIGRTVVFTITATNNGPNNATGVIVDDILQSGYTYVSSTTTAGTYNSTTGVWTIGNLNNGASEILTVTATVNSIGNYVNTAVISGNEVDGNSINDVSVIETFPTDFFIPEGFSPNGDGTNDVFVIRGIQYYPDNTFVIFNRWGNKVFETTSYKNTWDGRSTLGLRVGGNELPIGTYFYVLDLGDGSDVYKGTIYLNR